MRRSHRGRSTLTPQTYLARPPWRYAWPGRRCWASAKGGRRAHCTACGRARQDAHSRDRSAVSKKCACTLHSATPRPVFPLRKMKCADDVYRNAHHSFIHHNPQMEIAPEVWPRGRGGRGGAGGQNAARPRSGQVWTPMPDAREARGESPFTGRARPRREIHGDQTMAAPVPERLAGRGHTVSEARGSRSPHLPHLPTPLSSTP